MPTSSDRLGGVRLRRIALILACVIAFASFSSATGGAEVWAVVDGSGAPISGAVVRSWEDGWEGQSDAEGRVLIPLERSDDVVIVATAGRAPEAFDLAGLKSVGTTMLRYEGKAAVPPRAEVFEVSGVLGRAIGIGGAAAASDTLRFPFALDEGARAATVELTWTPDRTPGYGSVVLRANAVARDGNGTGGFRTGASPLMFELSHPSLEGHPGEWEVVVQAADSLAVDIEVRARIVVEYGPRIVKRIEGALPVAPGEADESIEPTMDILSVTFTNETETDFQVELTVRQAGTMEPHSLPFAHWRVEWVFGEERYFASMRTSRGPAALSGFTEPRFDMGRCAPTCEAVRSVIGHVDWGAPGRIRMTIAKETVGDPAEGDRIDELAAYTFESVDGAPTRPLGTTGIAMVDSVASVRSYEFGVSGLLLAAADETMGEASTPSANAASRGWWLGLVGGLLIVGAASWGTLAKRRPKEHRYQRLRELGAGSYGAVHLARDTKLRRNVALKTIPWEGDLAGGLPRELEALVALRHPHIVQVYDVEVDGKDVVIVMEHVPGGDLAKRIDKERLSVGESLGIWMEIASALAAAHDARIVHCDVKPSNILLDLEGHAKLADFGTATPLAVATIGATPAMAGTPLYMAPEQLRGEPATPASDVFAMAAVAYRMLTGREIADIRGCRTSWDVLVARQAAATPAPPEDLDDEVSRLLIACLAADDRERPGARDVASRLGALLHTYGMPRYSSMA